MSKLHISITDFNVFVFIHSNKKKGKITINIFLPSLCKDSEVFYFESVGVNLRSDSGLHIFFFFFFNT